MSDDLLMIILNTKPGDYPDMTDLYPYSYHDEESESEKEADAFVAYLNSIARALLLGYGYDCDYNSLVEKNVEKNVRRRALPPELVYYIFELARIPSPYPEWVYCFPQNSSDCEEEWDRSMSANARRLRRERRGMQEQHNLDVPLSRLDLWSSLLPTHSTYPLHTPNNYPSSSNLNTNNNRNMNGQRSTTHPQHNFVLRSTFGSTARKTFFLTPSFSKSEIERMARIQVCTVSKDQGWVSNSRDGSWSWWEVGVVPAEDKSDKEGDKLPTRTETQIPTPSRAHISHFNPLASRSFQPCVGRPFKFTSPTSEYHDSLSSYSSGNSSTHLDADPHSAYSKKDEDAKLYETLRDAGTGARLAIIGCAKFPGWMCVASEGRVVVWTVFKPNLD